MQYYVYDVDVTEVSKSGDSTFNSSYRIVIPSSPRDNPKLDMPIAVNQYLEENNTNTKVRSIEDYKLVGSKQLSEINDEYDFHLKKKKHENKVKQLINNVKESIRIKR